MENRKECHPELRAVVVNRRMENMEQFLRVGVISSTHGIRGEVKVYPTTDDPERFLDLDEVILDTGREHKILEIEGVKFFKNKRYREVSEKRSAGGQRTCSGAWRKRKFYCGPYRHGSGDR